ncbi:hypothetical protein M595_6529, partial [Lyngbya aestuarii BL J]
MYSPFLCTLTVYFKRMFATWAEIGVGFCDRF